MKILMLGWEYPPHIAGGLGTACEGLTSALAKHDIDIQFVVPHLFGGERAPHMNLMDSVGGGSSPIADKGRPSGQTKITTTRIPALLSPYWRPEHFRSQISRLAKETVKRSRLPLIKDRSLKAIIDGEVFGVDPEISFLDSDINLEERYGSDIFDEIERFTANVIDLHAQSKFDLIHAHDWMTFPAAVALSELTGKPLVLHVHSLEFDRSGDAVNHQISHIEKFGLQAADRVIAVSYYTQRMINERYGIPKDKIRVVHNGVYPKNAVKTYQLSKTWPKKVVLFLGRVTFQKGPDYFVEVASRVVPHVPDVLFVLAGQGDMLPRLIQRAEELGMQEHFLFPGFLKGEEVEEMFSAAHLYVMPSVSEPFGITALEAINFDTPVIISKQSGVSEVIGHALRSDFWDLDRMADLIINALLHEELRQDMLVMAKEELRRLHWDAAAIKTIDVYDELV